MAPLTPIHPLRRYERGGAPWVTLLLLAALAGGAYLLAAWVPIYLVHYEVKQTVRDYMNQAVKNRNDAELIQNLSHKLETLDTSEIMNPDGTIERRPSVVVAPADITWERDADAKPPMLHVAFEYQRQVRYPFSARVSEWTGTVDLTNDLTIPDWGPAR